QSVRDFVAAYERAFPGEVVRVSEPVTLEYDVMALVLEYERRRRWPILLFEKIVGADMPVVANVVASRRALAWALGVPESAVALGLHPLVSMGSLAYPPPDVGKFEVVGGLFGEPLEVAPCTRIDLTVPAAAEIVIEGEILAGVREPEGPFGEFTGYFSRRSTEHVFQAKAISMRAKPWFQSIGSGRAGDHITTLALVREAEIWNALRRVIPNVTGVHVPLSGTSSFSAYVSIKQGRPGEAKHVIPIVLGVDHYLKLVIVVDDDIDVFDESDVMWAVATRMQADRDLVTIAGSLVAMLDP